VNQKLATIALAIAALAVVLVFLFLPGPPAPTALKGEEAKVPAKEDAPSETYSSDLGSDIGVSAPTAGAPTAATSSPPGMSWEDRLDELLTTEADNTIIVRGLISSMRGLPPEAQEEFVAHAVNLCEDEQFDVLANVYLDAGTPSEVKETIFNDVLNRPDEIKLPLLAKTLRFPTHPMTGESKEILEMYLDLQPGTVPPNGWEQAVTEYIREQRAP
jgi:hypothetical protein